MCFPFPCGGSRSCLMKGYFSFTAHKCRSGMWNSEIWGVLKWTWNTLTASFKRGHCIIQFVLKSVLCAVAREAAQIPKGKPVTVKEKLRLSGFFYDMHRDTTTSNMKMNHVEMAIDRQLCCCYTVFSKVFSNIRFSTKVCVRWDSPPPPTLFCWSVFVGNLWMNS